MQIGKRKNSQRVGFSLLEVVFVLAILGVIAALATPALMRARNSTENKVVVNDLRIFSEAFNRYNVEQSGWPSSQGDASFPSEMQGYLSEASWSNNSPVGGNYQWYAPVDLGDTTVTAAIAIQDSNITLEQVEKIDSVIDDGNTSTGEFRLGIRNYPVIILEN